MLCAWAGAFGAFARSSRRPGAATASRRAHRAAPAVPGRQGQRSRRGGFVHRGGDYVQLGAFRSAPNWFSPPAEQCRIRGYFCRPVCFYARVGCALPGVAPSAAAGGGGAGRRFDGAGRGRGSSPSERRRRGVARSVRGLRPRLAGAWVTRSVRRSSRPSIVRSTPRHGATASRTRSAGPAAATLGSPARTTREGSRLSGNRLGIGVFE